MGFTHLHVHSEYSLLDSTCRIEQLVERAASLGMQSLAVTDTGVLYGAIPFYKACKSRGIHPIIGMEVSIKNDEVRQRGSLKSDPATLILLAENEEGYSNIIKISTLIQKERYQSIPRETLKQYTSGVIALSGGSHGEIEAELKKSAYQEALKLAQFYKDIYPNRFYLELHDHGLAAEGELLLLVTQLAKDCDLPLVATNDVHYLTQKEALAHLSLSAIRMGKTLKEMKQEQESFDQYYLKSHEEMEQLFQAYPEALRNTEIIANMCHISFEFGNYQFPQFDVPEPYNAKTFLKTLCEKGAAQRFGVLSDVVKRRLDYELSVIDQMGFNDYFLIVWDCINYARQHGITPGPGRGSAAGALVSYVLYITDVDPIKHHLLFERFLNPERVSMPDIDIDFPDDRRDEMIAYAYQKYGSERVAQIGTFGTLAAKAAIRDIGKVLEIPSNTIDRIAKFIPSKPGVTLEEAYKDSKQLQELIRTEKEVQTLFKFAHMIEGLPRHTSIHAAGIIISRHPLINVVPLAEGRDGIHVTQYPMDVLESLGLLKMDFLSLRNLTFIKQILDLVEEQKGIRLNVDEFPLDDPATYKLLSDGDTTGVFQFERDGLRNILKKLKPTDFEDIVAVNALNRPGPMQNIPIFIDAKHGRVPIQYPHPDLEPILKSTYGIIVYQEQIMQVAAKMAGYSLGEADILRRAVSKKKREVLEREEAHFVEGCLKNGYPEEVAKTLYDWIVRFADYGFNRSHSVAYTMIAYWLAYLKAHEPIAFMTALMSSVIHHPEKLMEYRYELNKKGIRLLPPSINKSDGMFKNTSDGIRYGLSAIKNVGSNAVQVILDKRRFGPYKGLFNLCQRVAGRHVNRRTLEALIMAGVLDEFMVDRAVLLASLESALKNSEQIGNNEGQTSLGFKDEISEAYVDVPPLSLKDKLNLEKEALGFYLTTHPLEGFSKKIRQLGTKSIQETCQDGARVTLELAIMVDQFRQVRTKSGQQMGLMVLNDPTGNINAVAFPKVFEPAMRLFKNGALLWVKGIVEQRGEEKQFIIQQVQDLQEIDIPHRLFLRIHTKNGPQDILNQLKKCLEKHHGNTEVIIYYAKEKQTIRLAKQYAIEPNAACLNELQLLLGMENVVLQ